MKIVKIALGSLETNCYIITDEKTGKSAVIDPGNEETRLLAAIKGAGENNIAYIFLTHGHFDHIGAVEKVREMTGAKVVVSKEDAVIMSDPMLNGSRFLGTPETSCKHADVTVSDGDVIRLGELTVRVIHTPGHTSGCVCYACEDVLFSGDTMFYQGCGRCDMPTSEPSKMILSLRRLVEEFSPETRVMPGHGQDTTIGMELRSNPYIGEGFYEDFS